jgi:hypothetical protein
MGTAPSIQFWSIVLHPAVDGHVIHMQSSIEHHLFNIPLAERVPKIPAYTKQNDVCLKTTPFARDAALSW